ncbi:MAG: hypothetical protein KDB22_13435 [Planctomycetales bacterium]|nr:hypothetical protein [Planctomycetales bacterium]
MTLVRTLKLVPTLLIIGTLLGCGPSDGRIEVNGIVLCDGEPLPIANVAFIGGGGGIFATGSTDEEGRFTIRAAPGVNKVSVGKFDSANAAEWAEMSEEDQLAGTPEEMAAAMKNAPKPLVAQRFFNAATSGIEFTVAEDMDDVTIEVSLK